MSTKNTDTYCNSSLTNGLYFANYK
jgi:hypothetical protein